MKKNKNDFNIIFGSCIDLGEKRFHCTVLSTMSTCTRNYLYFWNSYRIIKSVHITHGIDKGTTVLGYLFLFRFFYFVLTERNILSDLLFIRQWTSFNIQLRFKHQFDREILWFFGSIVEKGYFFWKSDHCFAWTCILSRLIFQFHHIMGYFIRTISKAIFYNVFQWHVFCANINVLHLIKKKTMITDNYKCKVRTKNVHRPPNS